NYNREIIESFKNDENPEILIVVDKLLTGFDAPRNTVLYLAKSLKEHNLLQAIARVNRIMEGMDFGYVIDYYGVLGELDRALTMYSALEGYSQSDLEETLKSVDGEIKSLPQKHSELWDIFKEIKNKRDSEEYELLLFDKQKRDKYYEKLTAFSRALGIALSSSRFHLNTPSNKIGKYKDDLRFFQNLRAAVKRRYAETIDYKEYEPKIQKLLDTYVTSDQIVLITDPVNIMDKDAFLKEVEKITSSASKADMIAHAVKRTTVERKEEDPVFYKKFSKLIQDAINDYREKRLSEADYLKRATEIMEIVRDRKDPDMPECLEGRNEAQAFYGVIDEVFSRKHPNVNKQKSAELGIKIDDIIIKNIIVDWHLKKDIQNEMSNQIEDYLIDDSELKLEFEVIDEILEKVIHIAKMRYAE
ncbi:MAG: type I restriction endonuclease subunit R, partial [Alphaproteobacteria bacterium]|nr:type I restriction endonuclease subunit R [Alphaproteobacteria bacterium]